MAEKERKAKEQSVEPKKPVSKAVLWIVIGTLVFYLILIGAGVWAFKGMADHNRENKGEGVRTTKVMHRSGFEGERTFVVQQSTSDGLTTTTTNKTYTQTRGVVTKVNSDSIVVAGGGKSQTIKTDASTGYSDGTKPAVNDTVIVVGTKDGDAITATEIAVYN
jgi:hypothetical protein